MSAKTNLNLDQYQFTVRPLSKDEGGGYLVEYPDLPGCAQSAFDFNSTPGVAELLRATG